MRPKLQTSFHSWKHRPRFFKFFVLFLHIKRHQKNTQAKVLEKIASWQHALVFILTVLIRQTALRSVPKVVMQKEKISDVAVLSVSKVNVQLSCKFFWYPKSCQNGCLGMEQGDFGEENLQSKPHPSRTEGSNTTRSESRRVRVVGDRWVHPVVARGVDDLEDQGAVKK